MGVAVNIDPNVAVSALFIKYTTEVIIDHTFNSNDSRAKLLVYVC